MISPPAKNRIILFLTLTLLILMGTSAVLIWTKPVGPTGSINITQTDGATGLTGDFSLVDENGATVTPATYTGQYKLIFFGFTHCPSVCPTELLKIADIMAALPTPVAARITPLFITVDPARDTADALKKYTDNFDPRIVGLTGTDAQIHAAINAFKVYAARVDIPATPNAPGIPPDRNAAGTENTPDYTFDHSTFLYLFGPDHDLIKLYRMNDTADDITADLSRVILP